MSPLEIYLICLVFVTVFGPKSMKMTRQPSYDRPITWGDVTLSLVLGLLPWLNVAAGVLVAYCYLDRGFHYLQFRKFFNTPVFKQKD